jgi:hypothetical protein
MVVVVAMNIGLMTPPIGIGFYIACKIGNVSPDEAMGAIWPYLLALLVGLVLIAAIPASRPLPVTRERAYRRLTTTTTRERTMIISRRTMLQGTASAAMVGAASGPAPNRPSSPTNTPTTCRSRTR